MGKERRAAALSDPKTRNPQLNLSSLKGEARKTLKDEISRTIQLDLWNWVVQQPPENLVLLDEHDRTFFFCPRVQFYLIIISSCPIRPTPGNSLQYSTADKRFVCQPNSMVLSNPF
jgi:hypothetical protein